MCIYVANKDNSIVVYLWQFLLQISKKLWENLKKIYIYIFYLVLWHNIKFIYIYIISEWELL